MKDCASPEGHEWSDRPERPESPRPFDFAPPLSKYPTATFHGVTSQMVRCSVPGCNEIGYRIQEVAQSVSQEDSRG